MTYLSKSWLFFFSISLRRAKNPFFMFFFLLNMLYLYPCILASLSIVSIHFLTSLTASWKSCKLWNHKKCTSIWILKQTRKLTSFKVFHLSQLFSVFLTSTAITPYLTSFFMRRQRHCRHKAKQNKVFCFYFCFCFTTSHGKADVEVEKTKLNKMFTFTFLIHCCMLQMLKVLLSLFHLL